MKLNIVQNHLCTKEGNRALENACGGLMNSLLQMHHCINLESNLWTLKIFKLIFFFFPKLHNSYALQLFYVSVQQTQLFNNMPVFVMYTQSNKNPSA